MSNFSGESVGLSAGAFQWGGTAFKDKSNRAFTGGAIGWSPWGKEWGAHASRITTTAIPVRVPALVAARLCQ